MSKPLPDPGPQRTLSTFLAAARGAGAEFAPMPFWFWNDDLDETELLRQLDAFQAGGMGGIVLHPRVGLGRAVGYLTPAYFHLVRRVVDACAARGMKVVLYDEGSYPSGSAGGAVARENPAHAAHALALVRREVPGPFTGYWRPAVGRSLQQRLVAAVLARLEDGVVDPDSLVRLEPLEHGLVRLEAAAGSWCALACVDVPSGGTIRGVLEEEEDGTAMAPPAGDLLNPEAVAAFLRLTHERYAAHLGDHLGHTVVALFTDEPNLLGRGARRGVQPYTPGFEADVARRLGREDVRAWLPALWVDYGPGTAGFRRAYAEALEDRLRRVFYGAQSAWCAAHGLALTGHPAASDDMASLAGFQWPGQDMVWRWVTPGGDSGLEGPHSVAPKAATSAARAAGRRRAASELFGAYGWRLSLDEAKWLLDWHLARGNNLFFPHAFFYSLRGGRAFESEPDLGPHNPWWPHFQRLAAYARRLCWLLTDADHVCDVALLGEGGRLPWEPARPLYEGQIDFLYVDGAALERGELRGGRLRVGPQAYRAVVVDAAAAPPPRAQALLAAFAAAGGPVLAAEPVADLAERLRAAVAPAVAVDPPAADLRVLHVRKQGIDAWAVFHEGEAAVAAALEVAGEAAGGCWWWDPLRDALTPAQVLARDAGRTRVRLALERRESRVLLLGGEGGTGAGDPPPTGAAASAGPQGSAPGQILPLAGPWEVRDAEGRAAPAPAPGDWTTAPALERFAGTLTYATVVRLAAPPSRALLDLGAVGEAAEVEVNGQPGGWALWAPHRVEVPPARWRAGDNLVGVRVTNSAANFYEGAMRPSGLLGPVCLRLW